MKNIISLVQLNWFLIIPLWIKSVNLQDSKETVHKYNEELFHLKLSTYNHYILFFTPWSTECKNVFSTWEEIGQKYNNMNEAPVIVAKVDCSVEEKLCEEQHITEYPTIKLFKVGTSSDGGILRMFKYRGVKDQESLEHFIHLQIFQNTEPSWGSRIEKESEPLGGLHILHDEDFEPAIKSVKHVFVNFCASWSSKCKDLVDTWQKLAVDFQTEDSYITAKIDCVSQKVTCQDHSIKSFPSLVWFTDGKIVEKYPGKEYDLESLRTFSAKMLNKKDYKPPKPLDDETLNRLLNEDDEEEGSYQTFLHVLDKNNFYKKIKKPNSIYIVNFYTPWCSDCQSLDPLWEQIAEMFSEPELIDKFPIKFAKFDCTRNKKFCDEEEKIEDYPTLKIYRDGEYVTTYKGKLKILAISQFITQVIFEYNPEKEKEEL